MRSPEEINRILTDRISDFLYCPTRQAVKNLAREGFRHFGSDMVRCGDVMYDAALHFGRLAAGPAAPVKKSGLAKFAVCTLHRAENTDDGANLKSIVRALNAINEQCSILMPMHPRTRQKIRSMKLHVAFRPIAPVGYLDMIRLLRDCEFVLTDSGGLQKESYFFKKPCIVLRDETEWSELQESGYVQLAGADYHKLVRAAARLIRKKPEKSYRENFYGRGNAATLIAGHLLRKLS
jgi:UDP-GlcNAc3NAcA epimerase